MIPIFHLAGFRICENGRGSKDDLRSVRFASRFVAFDGPGTNIWRYPVF